ncbi:MAG: pentapeptide repeat-containing protein [Candidatus Aminicenantes bacterium]|nr:MAG: pentapeptide repeat-containing protein [Candidatus Aminicenantes bacterium]
MMKGNKSMRPEPPEWLIELIVGASKKAQRSFLFYVGFLAYCLLSVISISDRQIGLSSTVNLPPLNVDVPLVGFFIATPLLLVLIFVYLQICILRFKRLTAYLDTQYSSAEKWRFLPWIIKAVKVPGTELPDRFLKMITALFLWASLPISLILIALRFIKRHDSFWSYVVGSIPILGTIIVIWFWRIFSSFIRSKSLVRTVFRSGVVTFLVAAQLFLLLFLIPWANDGLSVSVLENIRDRIRPFFCVNLSNQILIEELAAEYEGRFWGDFKKKRLEGAILNHAILKRANLEGASLRDARMDFTVAVQANIRYSYMKGAYLSYADFQGADMSGANLVSIYGRNARFSEANFWNADMRGGRLEYSDFQAADLTLADLSGARLWDTNFRNARLFHANLLGAELVRADFSKADLKKAVLRGADLWGANLLGAMNLDVEQLSEAKTLYNAKLDPKLMKEIEKKYPHLLEKQPY